MKRFSFFLMGLCCVISLWAQTFSTFNSRTDFRDESIYFVMTTRFYDGDPANNTQCWDNQSANEGDPCWRGDFKGLIDKLDYIKALGFTAIWITPVVENASGYDYHGYHASDFSKVDRRYETHDASGDVTLKSLVDAAHARGMKIIVDIVLNHTGNFGERNLCPLFNRDWSADQSDIDACMVPIPQKDGGLLPANYLSLPGGKQYAARLSKMKNSSDENGQKKNYDSHNYYHHFANFNWDNATRWWAQIAGDCVDLNTENPAVYNYLIKCYSAFIALGVDGFRIDTSGHIPRLTFNKAFIPAFIQAGKDNTNARGKAGTPFYMFGEVCARANDVTYRNTMDMSPYYYTWAETKSYAWDNSETSFDNIVAMEGDECNTHTNHKSCWQQDTDDSHDVNGSTPTSNNAFLNGNTYHPVDYSKSSGFNVIDFTTHWNFCDAQGAWNTMSEGNDKYYNDATWNVVYVDSHDYSPDCCQQYRYTGSQEQWAENLSLMFTFRGIPCIYYGSEIEFRKGKPIDKGPSGPLFETGRAYFGGYIKGTINASDFGVYTATGNAAQTLSYALAQHIQRLNRIRQAVPALRKGQYAKVNSNGMAFKRRYTDSQTDSYVLVTISGNANFTGIPNGTYKDCVTGDVKNVTNGTLSVSCSGKGNMRVYVLDTQKTPAPGKIGDDGKYLYTSSPKNIPDPKWDGTQEEKTGGDTPGPEPVVTEPCLETANQHVVFFTKPDSWGSKINCYVWDKNNGTTPKCGGWPGSKAISLGNGVYKYAFEEAPSSGWMIIWNDGSNQTNDLVYSDRGMYAGTDRNNIKLTTTITKICETTDLEDAFVQPEPITQKFIYNGNLYIRCGDKIYDAFSRRVR